MGNTAATEDYRWGECDADGWQCVRSLSTLLGGRGLKWVPREFDVVGILDRGLECDMSSLEAMSSSGPRGLLVGLGEDKDGVIEVCKALNKHVDVEGYKRVGGLTDGSGVMLTFPTLLEVSGAVPC